MDHYPGEVSLDVLKQFWDKKAPFENETFRERRVSRTISLISNLLNLT